MPSRRKKIRDPCLVCGDKSIGYNFGVLTCMPCKAFFRRNAVKLGNYEFICSGDGDCEISHAHRRLCNCCRLAKCFRVGMKRELILTDAEKEARKEIIERNRKERSELSQNKSLALIRPSNLLRSTYSQSRCLSSCDQTLLTNISNAYEQTYMKTRNTQALSFPSKPHESLHSLLNEYCGRHISLINYFKIIPEFNRISIKDKIRLIRNHFGTMLNINESSNQLAQYDTIVLTIENMFGNQLGQYLLHCIQLIQRYSYDPIILKLVLIIECLSGGTNRYRDYLDMDRIYDDTHAIFVSQNVYVELLWRYILSRLPSERDAVKFFNKLILDLLVVIDVSFMTETVVYSFSGEIDKMEPLLQSIWPRPSN